MAPVWDVENPLGSVTEPSSFRTQPRATELLPSHIESPSSLYPSIDPPSALRLFTPYDWRVNAVLKETRRHHAGTKVAVGYRVRLREFGRAETEGARRLQARTE